MLSRKSENNSRKAKPEMAEKNVPVESGRLGIRLIAI